MHPLYYGALMFAQAAPAGSRLLRVVSSSQGPLRAWATLAPDHHIRVLLINDSLSSSALAVVRTPGAPRAGEPGAAARVQRICHLGPDAGRPDVRRGHRAPACLAPAMAQAVTPHGGTYSVTLPAGSAALLTLPASGG